MESRLLLHLLEANVLMVLLFLVYLLIRKQLSFIQRRFVLLSVPLLGAVIFLFKITGVAAAGVVYQLPVYQIGDAALANAAQPSLFEGLMGYEGLYWIGFIGMNLLLCTRAIRIIYKLTRAKATADDNILIVQLEGEKCFSFLNYVQLDPALGPDKQRVVLQHEKIHIQKRHSIDILFLEIVRVVNWFNPVIHLLKRELDNVHEYEVDQIMYHHHNTEYMELLLAYSLGTTSHPYLLTNQFYSKNGLIKRMKHMKTKTKNRWAFALTLPLVASTFVLVSWTFQEQKLQYNELTASSRMVETEADKMPEFKGGQEALIAYLSKTVVYPAVAYEGKIEGTVYVSFLVEASGKVSNCGIKRGAHEALDTEALRVVSAMPDWTPGEKNGKAVNVEMVLPIAFKL